MIEEIVKVLVDAGATHVSAARAAVILDAGGSVREAERELVLVDGLDDTLVAEALARADDIRDCLRERDRIVAGRDKNPQLDHWKVDGQLASIDRSLVRLRSGA